MTKPVLWIPKLTPALRYAQEKLSAQGIQFSDESAGADHWLLSVPSRDALPMSPPEGISVLGGGLPEGVSGYDFLKDEAYLWENAAITADCAIQILRENRPDTLRGARILIVGWGRIARHLARDLSVLGASVTAAARKEADRAMAASFGLGALDTAHPEAYMNRFDCIFNTVPEMILPTEPDVLAIDLASRDGIAGANVIRARGLPGKMAPAAAGALIAKTVHRILAQKEVNL